MLDGLGALILMQVSMDPESSFGKLHAFPMVLVAEDLCEHKRLGHQPMWNDCKVCQLANKKRKKHKKHHKQRETGIKLREAT